MPHRPTFVCGLASLKWLAISCAADAARTFKTYYRDFGTKMSSLYRCNMLGVYKFIIIAYYKSRHFFMAGSTWDTGSPRKFKYFREVRRANRARVRPPCHAKYSVSQKDVYTRLIFRIIMCIHLFGIPCTVAKFKTNTHFTFHASTPPGARS
jgi:hypothetical protein